jgi:hypothetical protein
LASADANAGADRGKLGEVAAVRSPNIRRSSVSPLRRRLRMLGVSLSKPMGW